MDCSIQKVFDWTRKTTLTVYLRAKCRFQRLRSESSCGTVFHIIFPSESFGWKFF